LIFLTTDLNSDRIDLNRPTLEGVNSAQWKHIKKKLDECNSTPGRLGGIYKTAVYTHISGDRQRLTHCKQQKS